jgi:2-polyprenyl-3-methyl-5-hydroxy-6-metoxy-1,4-benzoquinol methylase
LTSTSDVPLNTLGTWVEIFYPMWQFLSDALKEGTPRYEQALGTSAAKTWEALFGDPERLRLFCRFMNAYSIPIGRQIADQWSFGGVKTVLDVAGGAGGLSAQIAIRHPHLNGIVMDLPPVCEIARDYLRSVGLSSRFTVVSGDLFNGPYPKGADAIILSWILHDWSDEKCQLIVRNCFDALPADGVLLLSEIVLKEDGDPRPFGNIMNMHMLIACDPGAKERTESEYRQLLQSAGFQRVEMTRLSGPRDLIVARKSHG